MLSRAPVAAPVPAAAPAAAIDRIVVVSDDAVQSGGAAQIALASIRAFRRRGMRVTVLAGEDGADPMLAELGVDVVPLGGRHLLEGARLQAALRGLYDGRIRAGLEAWIAANDTPGTIYHLHNWHKALSPAALSALRAVEPRLVMTAHDFFLACPNGGYFNYRRDRVCELTPMGAACLVSACDKRHYAHKLWRVARQAVRTHLFDLAATEATVIAVHDGMLPLLARAGIPAAATTVVRNPVTPWLAERVPAERNREILYVGRIEHDKGIDVLLEAAQRIGAPLRVIGDGPLRPALEARYPQAMFMGRLPHAAIAELGRQARLVALPTRVRETFGLVALESLMSGIPVVTSTSALIAPEIVGLGMAKTSPPGNVPMLAQALGGLMRDDAAVAAMSHRAFAGARALAPTAEDWGESLLALYRAKLARAARAELAPASAASL